MYKPFIPLIIPFIFTQLVEQGILAHQETGKLNALNNEYAVLIQIQSNKKAHLDYKAYVQSQIARQVRYIEDLAFHCPYVLALCKPKPDHIDIQQTVIPVCNLRYLTHEVKYVK
jgi:hypothetical protein